MHLLTANPEEKLAEYVAAGADVVTIHIETCRDPLGALEALGRMPHAVRSEDRIVRGIAINPATPLSALEPVLEEVEMIVVLAVDAVHGEHPSMEAVERRMAKVKKMITRYVLCIDGGVKRDNIERFAAMKADLLVSGSALFAGDNPVENVTHMLEAMRSA